MESSLHESLGNGLHHDTALMAHSIRTDVHDSINPEEDHGVGSVLHDGVLMVVNSTMNHLNHTMQQLINGTALDHMMEGTMGHELENYVAHQGSFEPSRRQNATLVNGPKFGSDWDHVHAAGGSNERQFFSNDHGGHDVLEASHVIQAHGSEHWMAFHTTYIGEVILFDSWTIQSLQDLIGSVIGIFFLAILYEGLKYFRNYLDNKQPSSDAETNEKTSLNGTKKSTWISVMFSSSHCVQTLFHLIQLTLNYFLMLIFMTFNVWLCIAVLAGSVFGFFIFGWSKAKTMDTPGHCH